MADGIGRAAGDILDAAMPWVRRYGRALTKSQIIGDGLAARARLTARRDISNVSVKAIRIALFRALHEVWTHPPKGQLSLTAARARVSQFTPGAVETLLLRAVEQLSFEEIAEVLHVPEAFGLSLFEAALEELPFRTSQKVLIVENDPLTAMNMADCVSDMGCVVTGVARTVTQALELVETNPPDLILSAAHLADKSHGETLFHHIKEYAQTIGVVIITPEPEALLTGQPDEPLFVLRQPFLPDEVHDAVKQAFILTGT